MRLPIALILICGFLLASPADARRRAKSSFSKPLLASAGMGLTLSPDLLLISPQVEILHKKNFYYGPLIQLGLGSGTLITATGTIRFILGRHPKLKPTVEAGFGIAAASGIGGSSVGLHILAGMGVDYVIDKDISIGSIVRLNFAPPLQTFFASWPLLVGRFHI